MPRTQNLSLVLVGTRPVKIASNIFFAFATPKSAFFSRPDLEPYISALTADSASAASSSDIMFGSAQKSSVAPPSTTRFSLDFSSMLSAVV